MSDSSARIFSLAETNKVIPQLSDFTAEVVQQLDAIRQRHKLDSSSAEPSMPESALKEVEAALRRWSERVIELGGLPKGYFTVDFRSVDPELLYCWTYGEDKILYSHKVWETFTHRKPLAAGMEVPTDHLRWVN